MKKLNIAEIIQQENMDIFFLLSLFIIAYLYSSVGHGGASGYLALMALFSIEPGLMRSSALFLNLFVSGIAFSVFYKAGYFRWRIVFPFLISSIPFSFIGACIEIDPRLYKIILGTLLLLAVFRILIRFRDSGNLKAPPVTIGIFLGVLLGLVSGMIGIGGGIILSPLLLIMRWANVKEAAAASALFILLNSTSGLMSLSLQNKFVPTPDLFLWVIVGIAGATAGSYSGGYKLSFNTLRYILSLVLILASFKLFIV
jgi:uncharacterized membrane protein YfcA